MRIFAIFCAFIVIILGFRLITTALRAALSGKVLVRRGLRTEWRPVSSMNEVWGAAFRDTIMGILLIVLGIALMT